MKLKFHFVRSTFAAPREEGEGELIFWTGVTNHRKIKCASYDAFNGTRYWIDLDDLIHFVDVRGDMAIMAVIRRLAAERLMRNQRVIAQIGKGYWA